MHVLSRKRVIVTVLGVLVLCCVVPLGIRQANQSAYETTRAKVVDVLKPGMSERQVYEALSRAGTLTVYYPDFEGCHIEAPESSQAVWIWITSFSWSWSTMGLEVCLDGKGTMIGYREMFD